MKAQLKAAVRATRFAAIACIATAVLTAPIAAQTAAAPSQSAAPSTFVPAGKPIDSPLNQQLAKIFPEIAQGYLDLNGNGKPDVTADLNETIPESRVKDGQLQAQEILDFIVANWRFISLDKLKAVQTAVKSAQGAIGELIAIDFAAALDDAVSQRAAMGDTLYLTPAAYKEAMAKIGDIITAMATAYKKEGQKAETDFVSNRDALFAMIEKGYPLPEDIPSDERATLSTAMMNTAMKEQKSSPAKTKNAIKALGRLGAIESAPLLLGLVDSGDYQVEAITALGAIGYKPALPVLAKLVKTSKDPEVGKAALRSLGAIGGNESLDAILDLLKPANKASLNKDFVLPITQALSGIAQKGNADQRVQAALKDLSASDDPAVRKAAAAGMGAFVTPASSDALLAVLSGDKDPAVRAQAVVALGRQKSDATVPALMKVLREKDLDPTLAIATISVLGDLPSGSQAVGILVDNLGDKTQGVREAAAAALVKLYPGNQPIVSAAISRALLASQDELFLGEGSALLAVLADQGSLPSLLTLLQKPFPEVKRNAAWAFYRIHSSSNPRVMDELQKLVTSENETISVRVTAVRALGAIGYDSPQLNLWQTLSTIAQMRGDKYASLRYYAVQALGQVGSGKSQAIAALARIAAKDADVELRKQAVMALRDMAASDQKAEDALAASYAQAEDDELKVLILEALADMGSDKAPGLAGEFLSGKANLAQKRRAMGAVSQSASEEAASALVDASRDAKLSDFAEALLEGYPSSLMSSFVQRRLRTETDKNAISVLEGLDSHFAP
jgi:HEAT repeat protein